MKPVAVHLQERDGTGGWSPIVLNPAHVVEVVPYPAANGENTCRVRTVIQGQAFFQGYIVRGTVDEVSRKLFEVR